MLGAAALRARDDGTLDYLPPIPSDLVQTALKAAALQRQAEVVVNENLVVGRKLPCAETWSRPVSNTTSAFHRTLKERLRDALRARLYPNTNLHPKQLCHALKITRNTLDNWLSANNEARGEHLIALMQFFDGAFADEVSGGIVTKLADARAIEAVRKYHAAKQELMDALR